MQWQWQQGQPLAAPGCVGMQLSGCVCETQPCVCVCARKCTEKLKNPTFRGACRQGWGAKSNVSISQKPWKGGGCSPREFGCVWQQIPPPSLGNCPCLGSGSIIWTRNRPLNPEACQYQPSTSGVLPACATSTAPPLMENGPINPKSCPL